MKRILLAWVCAFFAAFGASAQTYQETTDTVWGANYVPYYDGRACSLGYDKSSYSKVLSSWPMLTRQSVSSNIYDISLGYIVHLPAGYVNAKAYLTTKTSKTPTITATLSNVATGEELLSNTFSTTAGEENVINVMPNFNVPADGWYLLLLNAGDGRNSVSKMSYIVFERESGDAITTPIIYSSLASYLSNWTTTDPNAPSGCSYDWTYVEAQVPSAYDQVDTYWSIQGLMQGYLGIQSTKVQANFWYDYTNYHNTIFSVWDNGDTDIDKNLPDYLRSGALDWGDDVNVHRFKGEGTGCNTMKEEGQYWEPDKWVQFLFGCRPQDMTVTLKNQAGEDSATIVYPTTVLTLFYKMADEDEWQYQATIRASGVSNYVDSWSSFIENWSTRDGHLKRQGLYRNAFRHSLASGKWYNSNQVSTGKYDNTSSCRSDLRDRRSDFNHGISSEFENTFYMETGGFDNDNDFVDHTLTIDLATDNTCVDTINLDDLWKTVLGAFVNEKKNGIAEILGTTQNLDSLKAIAAEYIANANQFEYYTDDDLANVISVYNEGNCTDAGSLYTALADLITTAQPLVYSSVQRLENIGTYHAHQLYNANGHGIVCASGTGDEATLYAAGSKDTDATTEAQQPVDVTDNFNNWVIVRSEPDATYYMYNLGAGQWLDLRQSDLLSDTPLEVSLTAVDGGYTIKQKGNYLAIDPTNSTASVVSNPSSDKYAIFELRDNVTMQPSQLVVDALLGEIESYEESIATPKTSNGLFLPSKKHNANFDWSVPVMIYRSTDSSTSATVLQTPPNDNNGKAWYDTDYELTDDTRTADGYTVDNNGQWTETAAPFTGWASMNVTGDIYLRRTFTNVGDLWGLILSAGHDDAPTEYYINGKLAYSPSGYNELDSAYIISTSDAYEAINTDGSDNVLAVHIHQTTGGYYADCGLYAGATTNSLPNYYDNGRWDCVYQFVDANQTIDDNWYAVDNEEDPDTWITGQGPFHNNAYSSFPSSTYWTSSASNNLYVRRHLTLNADQLDAAHIAWMLIAYDQDPEVYLNGQKVFTATSYTPDCHSPRIVFLDPTLFVAGDNVVAVKAGAGNGGQYLDFGLYIAGDTFEDTSQTYTLTVEKYGTETLYLDFPAEIPFADYSGLLAVAYIDGVSESGSSEAGLMHAVKLKKYIPAHTGVVVIANAGSYTFPYHKGADETVETACKSSILSGVLEDTDVSTLTSEGTVFTLTHEGESYISFAEPEETIVEANRAYYLAPSTTGTAKAYNITFSGQFTGITSPETSNFDAQSSRLYDLQGRRLTDHSGALKPGIYIQDGKKLVVK